MLLLVGEYWNKHGLVSRMFKRKRLNQLWYVRGMNDVRRIDHCLNVVECSALGGAGWRPHGHWLLLTPGPDYTERQGWCPRLRVSWNEVLRSKCGVLGFETSCLEGGRGKKKPPPYSETNFYSILEGGKFLRKYGNTYGTTGCLNTQDQKVNNYGCGKRKTPGLEF